MVKKSLKRIHTTSLCIRHGLIQIKVLHRLHYSNEKLARIYPNIINPECPRCSHNPATVGHMFWACRSLNSFKAISYIPRVTVDPDPVIGIFAHTLRRTLYFLPDKCHSVSNADGREIDSYAVEVGKTSVIQTLG